MSDDIVDRLRRWRGDVEEYIEAADEIERLREREAGYEMNMTALYAQLERAQSELGLAALKISDLRADNARLRALLKECRTVFPSKQLDERIDAALSGGRDE
jgi:hypothetical protein